MDQLHQHYQKSGLIPTEKPADEGLSAAPCSALWRVPHDKTSSGERLRIGISLGLVIVLYRDNHGWRAGEGWSAFAHLPHQLYRHNLAHLVALKPREIVAVNLKGHEWVTLWARDDREVSYPQNSQDHAPEGSQ